MTDSLCLSSQIRPPALDKPTKAAKLIVKTESRELLNMATSGRGTKTSDSIPSPSLGSRCEANVQVEATLCISEESRSSRGLACH